VVIFALWAVAAMSGGQAANDTIPGDNGTEWIEKILSGEMKGHRKVERSGNGGNGNNETYTYYRRPFDHFSKIGGFEDDLVATILPLEHYPLDEDTSDILRTKTLAASPMRATDLPNVDANELIEAIGGWPSMPGEPEFWDEIMHVATTQMLRMSNWTPPFPLPTIWESFTINDVAEAVHNEYPGYWHQILLERFWAEGLQLDYSVMPFRCTVDFIGKQIMMSAVNSWSINHVSSPNFLVKWTVGRIRPEEAAFQIAQDMLEEVPPYLRTTIKILNIATPEQFTAYPEGCPTHPSWPAMHSAASAASLWLATVADLTPEQYCQVLLTDYGIAFARTVAGVHYESDNIAGLNLGQLLVSRALPDYLATNFGADKAAAEAKIAKLRFDWATFDPSTCTVIYTN